MKANPAFAFFVPLLCLMACSTEVSKKIAPPMRPAQQSLIIGDPLDYGMGNMILFPIGVSKYQPAITEGEKEAVGNVHEKSVRFSANATTLYDKGATSEYVIENGEETDIRNILFYNLTDKTSKPLLTDSLHILSFAIHKEFKNPCIFYRMVRHDHNKDGKYNGEDPVMLYISGLNGENLVQVSPENEKFIDYFYYEKQQVILVKTIVDNDQDSSFTFMDENNMLEVLLDKPAMGKELFDKNLKQQLRATMRMEGVN